MVIATIKNKIIRFLGFQPYRVSHTERLISALGAFFGILLILYTSSFFLDQNAAYLIVASMGASAVLLFAVPHGRLSQPWSLIAGHLISAIVGVSCAKFIPETLYAAPIAVGIAVGLMYYLSCIHPPGGATALTAVVGGTSVTELGYQFVFTPVLINVIAIFAVAVIFNFLFKWRRYPASLANNKTTVKTASTNESTDYDYSSITHEDFVYALSEFDTLLDVSESDLLTIYDLVTKRHEHTAIKHHELIPGHYYSNGEYGESWAVRQIIDWAEPNDDSAHSGEEKLIYKTIAGVGRRSTGVLSRNEFSIWAKHEVMRDEENWHRIDATSK